LEDFAAPVVNTYSVETTIAEKLDAILHLKAFSSRMKDYYDIYYLAQKFDFIGPTLHGRRMRLIVTAAQGKRW